MKIEGDYNTRKMVENSTMNLLQTMADTKPADFLKLLNQSKAPDHILDKETTERFHRLGLIDDVGNIHESVSKALETVHFVEQKPTTAKEIVDILTGGKIKEQIDEDIKNKKWPFAVSEEEMRRVVEETRVNKPDREDL